MAGADMTNFQSEEQREMEAEIEAQKKNSMKEIEQSGLESMTVMRESEKVNNIRNGPSHLF